MYHVILIYNEENSLSYYQAYTITEGPSIGNIVCNELPPYADIDKARSCYWDFDTEEWIYDEIMYQKILQDKERKRKEEDQERLLKESIPTIEEISNAIIELASGQSDLEDAITELASIVSEKMEV